MAPIKNMDEDELQAWYDRQAWTKEEEEAAETELDKAPSNNQGYQQKGNRTEY